MSEIKTAYYLKGRTIHKAPREISNENGKTRIVCGFPVCTVSEYADAETLMAILEDNETRTPDTSAKVDVEKGWPCPQISVEELAARNAAPRSDTSAKVDVEAVAAYIFDNRHAYKWSEASATQKGKYRNVAGLAIAALQAPRSDTSGVEKQYPLTPEGKPIFGEGSDWCAKSYFNGVADESAVELVRELVDKLGKAVQQLNPHKCGQNQAYHNGKTTITKAEQWLKNRGE